MKYQKSQYFGVKLGGISKKTQTVVGALVITTCFHIQMLSFVENILKMCEKTGGILPESIDKEWDLCDNMAWEIFCFSKR